jgi:hypothetical protein
LLSAPANFCEYDLVFTPAAWEERVTVLLPKYPFSMTERNRARLVQKEAPGAHYNDPVAARVSPAEDPCGKTFVEIAP